MREKEKRYKVRARETLLLSGCCVTGSEQQTAECNGNKGLAGEKIRGEHCRSNEGRYCNILGYHRASAIKTKKSEPQHFQVTDVVT